MKYIIVLGDGMADEPIDALGQHTPLEVANTPSMDWLAKKGRNGTLITIPTGFHPGSEIANLSVLGYDVTKVFEGRGSLEAASMGVDIEPDEMAMRCNLICIENDRIKNHSAGHISTEEASALIEYLNTEIGNDLISFHCGVSYRHLLKLKGGNKHINCTPPHDIPGTPFRQATIKATIPEAEESARLLNSLIEKSQKILPLHPINKQRIAQGKDPANSIWPWSPGYKPSMMTLESQYGLKNGVVISAVDLIRGIGVYAGLKPIIVNGATGLYDTNYEGKAQAAIEALKTPGCDFVYLHIEACDEAGHEGNVDLKIRTIEDLDRRVLKPILSFIADFDTPVTIALLPDHPTPCRLRTHTSQAVPFVIYNPNNVPDNVETFSESSAQQGIYGQLSNKQFIKEFLQ